MARLFVEALATLLKIAVRPETAPPAVRPPARPELKVVDRHPPEADTGDNGWS